MKTLIGKILYKLECKIKSAISLYKKSIFAECGNNLHIVAHASFMAYISHIYIQDYVVIVPNVTIRGGIIVLMLLVSIYTR